jgi:hypothetical protein
MAAPAAPRPCGSGSAAPASPRPGAGPGSAAAGGAPAPQRSPAAGKRRAQGPPEGAAGAKAGAAARAAGAAPATPAARAAGRSAGAGAGAPSPGPSPGEAAGSAARCSAARSLRADDDDASVGSTDSDAPTPGGSGAAVSYAKLQHLLFPEELSEIIESHGLARAPTEVLEAAQRAVSEVARRVVLDICSSKKSYLRQKQRLSVAASDVIKAMEDLGADASSEARAFYKYISSLEEPLGVEEEADQKKREQFITNKAKRRKDSSLDAKQSTATRFGGRLPPGAATGPRGAAAGFALLPAPVRAVRNAFLNEGDRMHKVFIVSEWSST